MVRHVRLFTNNSNVEDILGEVIKRILIVDDEVEILKPLESMLMEENFRVRSFSNPLNVLEFLRTQSVDLAIFDIKMPELNGLNLLRHAREIHPGLPIIFLSSKNEDAVQLVGFSFGADDYVGKPFTKQLLLLRVKAVLRRHAPMTNPTMKLIEVGSLVIDRERHLVLGPSGWWKQSASNNRYSDTYRRDASGCHFVVCTWWGSLPSLSHSYCSRS